MSRILRVLAAAAVCGASCLIILLSGCKAGAPVVVAYPTGLQTTAYQGIVPYIPPAYYQWTSVYPEQLENAYTWGFDNTMNVDQVNLNYDGQIFVFPDLLVDAWMLSEINQGNLLADHITCPIVNISYARTLNVGDQVDIVGICLGPDPNKSGWLLFEDCYVLPAGAIQLPASGGGTFVAGY
jgi:hypothetical protein